MTRRLAYSLFALLLLLFSSCSLFKNQEDPEEESQRSYHPNGQIHKEITNENDSVSIYKEFFNNGQLFQEVRSVNKLREGVVKKYHKTGILYEETPYEKGRPHGIQKKYRRSGALMAEVPYYQGKLCKGLKEYTVDGKVKQRYPEIVVHTVNNVRQNGTYTIELSLSDGSKDVEYFLGQLSEGVYLGNDATRLAVVENGVGKLQFKLNGGQFLTEELHFIAKVKTYQGNFHITEMNYELEKL